MSRGKQNRASGDEGRQLFLFLQLPGEPIELRALLPSTGGGSPSRSTHSNTTPLPFSPLSKQRVTKWRSLEEPKRPTPEWEGPERPTPEWEEPERPTPEWGEPERPQPKKEESVRPQPKREESVCPQPKREESVRPQPKREESVRPQPKREESVRPQSKEREVGACTALGPKLPAEGECLLVPPPPAEEQCLLSPCPPAEEECLLSLCPPAECECLLVSFPPPPPQSPARKAEPHQSPAREAEQHQSPAKGGDYTLLPPPLVERATTGRGADSMASHGPTEASLPSPRLCPGLLGF
ncbi:UNVERIFIED_CONTAM: hypothetical protein FKN15_009625 [Acipenser sinensis]